MIVSRLVLILICLYWAGVTAVFLTPRSRTPPGFNVVVEACAGGTQLRTPTSPFAEPECTDPSQSIIVAKTYQPSTVFRTDGRPQWKFQHTITSPLPSITGFIMRVQVADNLADPFATSQMHPPLHIMAPRSYGVCLRETAPPTGKVLRLFRTQIEGGEDFQYNHAQTINPNGGGAYTYNIPAPGGGFRFTTGLTAPFQQRNGFRAPFLITAAPPPENVDTRRVVRSDIRGICQVQRVNPPSTLVPNRNPPGWEVVADEARDLPTSDAITFASLDGFGFQMKRTSLGVGRMRGHLCVSNGNTIEGMSNATNDAPYAVPAYDHVRFGGCLSPNGGCPGGAEGTERNMLTGGRGRGYDPSNECGASSGYSGLGYPTDVPQFCPTPLASHNGAMTSLLAANALQGNFDDLLGGNGHLLSFADDGAVDCTGDVQVGIASGNSLPEEQAIGFHIQCGMDSIGQEKFAVFTMIGTRTLDQVDNYDTLANPAPRTVNDVSIWAPDNRAGYKYQNPYVNRDWLGDPAPPTALPVADPIAAVRAPPHRTPMMAEVYTEFGGPRLFEPLGNSPFPRTGVTGPGLPQFRDVPIRGLPRPQVPGIPNQILNPLSTATQPLTDFIPPFPSPDSLPIPGFNPFNGFDFAPYDPRTDPGTVPWPLRPYYDYISESGVSPFADRSAAAQRRGFEDGLPWRYFWQDPYEEVLPVGVVVIGLSCRGPPSNPATTPLAALGSYAITSCSNPCPINLRLQSATPSITYNASCRSCSCRSVPIANGQSEVQCVRDIVRSRGAAAASTRDEYDAIARSEKKRERQARMETLVQLRDVIGDASFYGENPDLAMELSTLAQDEFEDVSTNGIEGPRFVEDDKGHIVDLKRGPRRRQPRRGGGRYGPPVSRRRNSAESSREVRRRLRDALASDPDDTDVNALEWSFRPARQTIDVRPKANASEAAVRDAVGGDPEKDAAAATEEGEGRHPATLNGGGPDGKLQYEVARSDEEIEVMRSRVGAVAGHTTIVTGGTSSSTVAVGGGTPSTNPSIVRNRARFDIFGCERTVAADPAECCRRAFLELYCDFGYDLQTCFCAEVGQMECPTVENFDCDRSHQISYALFGLLGIIPCIMAICCAAAFAAALMYRPKKRLVREQVAGPPMLPGAASLAGVPMSPYSPMMTPPAPPPMVGSSTPVMM